MIIGQYSAYQGFYALLFKHVYSKEFVQKRVMLKVFKLTARKGKKIFIQWKSNWTRKMGFFTLKITIILCQSNASKWKEKLIKVNASVKWHPGKGNQITIDYILIPIIHFVRIFWRSIAWQLQQTAYRNSSLQLLSSLSLYWIFANGIHGGMRYPTCTMV